MEARKPHRNEAVILSFLLFGGGLVIVLYGHNEMSNADTKYDNAISNPEINPHIISTQKQETISNSQIYTVQLNYKAIDMLSANNPFNYSITAFVNNPNQFDSIVAVPWVMTSNSDTIPTTDQIVMYLKEGVTFQAVVLNRNPVDNTFFGSQVNANFSEADNIGFLLIPFTKGTPRGLVSAMDNLPLVINPEIEEFQLKTDRATQLQTIDSERSNKHVEGLTYIIIGLVPIALSLELWIHRRLT